MQFSNIESFVNESFKEVFNESKQKSLNLLNEYKKVFSEEAIINSKWLQGCTPDDKVVALTFSEAIDWVDPRFYDGIKNDVVSQSEVMESMHGDKKYKWAWDAFLSGGWENFLFESLWNKGCIDLPFPFSAIPDVSFLPTINGTIIKDPLEMAKKMTDGVPFCDLSLRQCIKKYRVVSGKNNYPFDVVLNTISIIWGKYVKCLDANIFHLLMSERDAVSRHVGHEWEQTDFLMIESIYPGTNYPVFTIDQELCDKLIITDCDIRKNTIERLFTKQGVILLPKKINGEKPPISAIIFKVKNTPAPFIDGCMISSNVDGNRGTFVLPLNKKAFDDLTQTSWGNPEKPYFASETHSFAQKILFNVFLYMQSIQHKDKTDAIEITPSIKIKGFSKNSKQVIVPRVIGEGYKPKVIHNYESVGTHASPRTHWRSGHWRQQPTGKKDNPEYKTIWIEPTLINA